jgi:uncharacterized protein YegL
MSIEDDVPNIEYVENPTERLPCVLVVDGSGSMEGDNAIQQLNDGLATFASELKGHAKARRQVRLKVIRCGGTVETLVDWTDAADFNPPIVDASGNTPLGEAVNLALDDIESEKRRLDAAGISRKRAWLFIFTDGEPTDDNWRDVAARCRQLEQSHSISSYGIAVNGANTENLRLFSSQNPPAMIGSTEFIAFFRYLSQQIKKASEGTKGETTTEGNAQQPWKFEA